DRRQGDELEKGAGLPQEVQPDLSGGRLLQRRRLRLVADGRDQAPPVRIHQRQGLRRGIPGMEGQKVSSRTVTPEEIIVRPGVSPLTARVRVLDAGFSPSPVQDVVKIVLRLALGALFVYGGWTKLTFTGDPTQFAFAIHGFKLNLPDHIV